jgi:hypothetical protein
MNFLKSRHMRSLNNPIKPLHTNLICLLYIDTDTFIMYKVHVVYIFDHVSRIAVCYNLSLTYFCYDYGSIHVYCASSVKLMPVPQAISQLFASNIT